MGIRDRSWWFRPLRCKERGNLNLNAQYSEELDEDDLGDEEQLDAMAQ